jgi:hypothetical protein
MARESALRLNPSAKIAAHHDNIKDAKYGPDFFAGFTLVLNALDNFPARRHVNRLCLATNVPLIDAGTAGYAGQVPAPLCVCGWPGAFCAHEGGRFSPSRRERPSASNALRNPP